MVDKSINISLFFCGEGGTIARMTHPVYILEVYPTDILFAKKSERRVRNNFTELFSEN